MDFAEIAGVRRGERCVAVALGRGSWHKAYFGAAKVTEMNTSKEGKLPSWEDILSHLVVWDGGLHDCGQAACVAHDIYLRHRNEVGRRPILDSILIGPALADNDSICARCSGPVKPGFVHGELNCLITETQRLIVQNREILILLK